MGLKIAVSEQFKLEGNRVVHEPTGALWSAYDGRAEPSHVNWGKAGDILPNGDEYDRHQVKQVALTILQERLR